MDTKPSNESEPPSQLDLEELDRLGYLAQPQRPEEYCCWEEAASWPEE